MALAPGKTLKLENVGVQYRNGHQALSDFSCEFEPASFTALVGPSGCGKSTLLRALAGLLSPSHGQIQGQDDRHFGLVFQEPTLLAWRTVFDNVALPLTLSGLRSGEVKQRVAHALTMVGLASRGDAIPCELSGGMKMRVSLARALAGRPQTLLLDEPFAALDELTRFRLDDDLRTIWQQEKTTIIFVTHSITEAAYLAQRVLVMNQDGLLTDTIEIGDGDRQSNFRADPAYHDACHAISQALGHDTAALSHEAG